MGLQADVMVWVAENKSGWDFRDNLLFRVACVLRSANLSSSPYSTRNQLMDLGQGYVPEAQFLHL